MVNVNDVYGGEYLNAARVEREELELTDLTIEEVELLEFNKTDDNTGKETIERKIGVFFEETDYTFILNKTNAKKLGDKFGDETDDWVGETVQLVIVETSFGKGIQVKFPPKKKAKAKPKAPNFERIGKKNEAIKDAMTNVKLNDDDITLENIVTELKAMKLDGDISKEEFEKAGQLLGFE